MSIELTVDAFMAAWHDRVSAVTIAEDVVFVQTWLKRLQTDVELVLDMSEYHTDVHMDMCRLYVHMLGMVLVVMNVLAACFDGPALGILETAQQVRGGIGRVIVLENMGHWSRVYSGRQLTMAPWVRRRCNMLQFIAQKIRYRHEDDEDTRKLTTDPTSRTAVPETLHTVCVDTAPSSNSGSGGKPITAALRHARPSQAAAPVSFQDGPHAKPAILPLQVKVRTRQPW
jgi:hypothetical protein